MKSFVIYIESHKESIKQAKDAYRSSKNAKFDVEMTAGITPKTLNNYKHYNEIANGRVVGMKRESKKLFETKMSCFLNHVEIWKKCLELNEPVAFIEHDSYCIRDWDNPNWEDVLIMNVSSAFKQKVFRNLQNKPSFDFGINQYNYSPLVYNKKNAFLGGLMMPGTAAYAITVKGAEKLLQSLEDNGWDQSDYFINTKNVNIQYAIPEYFTFKHKNLNTSHGI
jgi:GR25 family glycosyltransferase involved in LPS biosynthesis